MSRRFRRLGWRREIAIFLPAALAVLVALSAYTLSTYRQAIDDLVTERREEAQRLARQLAGSLPASGARRGALMAGAAAAARGVALLGPDGNLLATAGASPLGDPLAPVAGELPERAVVVGPGGPTPGLVTAFARLSLEGRRHWVRVDLDAGRLAALEGGAGALSAVVITTDLAVALLVLLFLRRLLGPYDRMLDSARRAAPPDQEVDGEADEIAFLVDTFERALANLSEGERGAAGDELAGIERELVSSLESGLLLIDRRRRLLALNPPASRLLGIDEESVGRPVDAALAPHPALASLVAEALAGERDARREEVTVERGGDPRHLGLTVHHLRRDDGGIRGHVVLFADLTEALREAREERLAESLSQLGELTAGVAHELRNSLATLQGYLALIERHPEEEAVTDYLSELRRESDHLQRVLEDFLSFARPGTTRMEELDLARLVRRAAADPLLAGHPIAIAEPLPPLRLHGDAQLLERALRNLLHNAVGAARRVAGAPPVEIRLRHGSDGAELAIADRGRGVPTAVRERLFQPFASGRPGGVGLGLALSHRIVTLHGGRLRLEDREGGGTRAVVSFPTDRIVTEGNAPAHD